jgi:hypothetical protein
MQLLSSWQQYRQWTISISNVESASLDENGWFSIDIDELDI